MVYMDSFPLLYGGHSQRHHVPPTFNFESIDSLFALVWFQLPESQMNYPSGWIIKTRTVPTQLQLRCLAETA